MRTMGAYGLKFFYGKLELKRTSSSRPNKDYPIIQPVAKLA